MTDHERYRHLMARMQTGVAVLLAHRAEPGCQPKHLRVGVNAALCDGSALAKLLIAKGVISEAEYLKAIADEAEREASEYQDRVRTLLGPTATIGPAPGGA